MPSSGENTLTSGEHPPHSGENPTTSGEHTQCRPEHPPPNGEPLPCSGEHLPHSVEHPQPSKEHVLLMREPPPCTGENPPLFSVEGPLLSVALPQPSVEHLSHNVDHPPSTDRTPLCVGHTTHSVVQLPHHTTNRDNIESVTTDKRCTQQESQITLSGCGKELGRRENDGRDDADGSVTRKSEGVGRDGSKGGRRGETNMGNRGDDEQEKLRENKSEGGRSGGREGDYEGGTVVGDGERGGEGKGEPLQDNKTDTANMEIVAGTSLYIFCVYIHAL